MRYRCRLRLYRDSVIFRQNDALWDVEHLGPQRLSGPGFVCVFVFVCVYIGIQLFSAKMKLAVAPPGREVWGGVGASTGMGYIGIQLFSAKMQRGRRREVRFGAGSGHRRGWVT